MPSKLLILTSIPHLTSRVTPAITQNITTGANINQFGDVEAVAPAVELKDFIIQAK